MAAGLAISVLGAASSRAACVSTTIAGATSVRCSDGSRATSTDVGGVTTTYFSDGSRTARSTERGSRLLDRRSGSGTRLLD
jgi:hypothetical protein